MKKQGIDQRVYENNYGDVCMIGERKRRGWKREKEKRKIRERKRFILNLILK